MEMEGWPGEKESPSEGTEKEIMTPAVTLLPNEQESSCFVPSKKLEMAVGVGSDGEAPTQRQQDTPGP